MANDAGIAEHLSREARGALFRLVCRAVEERVREERSRIQEKGGHVGRGRVGTVKAVAAELEVKVPTVKAWLADKWQAGNINADKLLRKAWELDPERTRRVLLEDLENHRMRLEAFLQK